MIRLRLVAIVTIAALLAPMTALCVASAPSEHELMPCCRPPGPTDPPVLRPCCSLAGEQPLAPAPNAARPIDAPPALATVPSFARPAPHEPLPPAPVDTRGDVRRLSPVLLI